MRYERNSRRIIARLMRDGWVSAGTRGSHHQFRHDEKPGRVTVPHPVKELRIGTAKSIYAQAGWTD